MRKLDLDYQRMPRRASWAAWMLLLLGCGWAVDMGLSYSRVQQEMQRLENTLRSAGMSLPAAQQEAAQYAPVELTRAHDIIEKIAVPWEELFKAVETVESERIALLALEPDAKAGTLSLGGEARDYPALLTYVARLEQAKPLHDVNLMRHEIRHDDPGHAVAFTITARWGKS